MVQADTLSVLTAACRPTCLCHICCAMQLVPSFKLEPHTTTTCRDHSTASNLKQDATPIR